MTRRKLGEILVSEGGLEPFALRVALNHQLNHGGRLGQALQQLGLCEEETVARALAKQQGLDFVDLARFPVEANAIKRVPFHILKKCFLFPMMVANRELFVASPPNVDLHALEQVAFASSMKVRPVIAAPSSIAQALELLERFTTGKNAGAQPGSEITVDA